MRVESWPCDRSWVLRERGRRPISGKWPEAPGWAEPEKQEKKTLYCLSEAVWISHSVFKTCRNPLPLAPMPDMPCDISAPASGFWEGTGTSNWRGPLHSHREMSPPPTVTTCGMTLTAFSSYSLGLHVDLPTRN